MTPEEIIATLRRIDNDLNRSGSWPSGSAAIRRLIYKLDAEEKLIELEEFVEARRKAVREGSGSLANLTTDLRALADSMEPF
jgi:hypothetical protein